MSLKIFVDFALTPQALELLRASAAGHELLFPSNPSTNVLAKSSLDPLFFEADVAFGQPEPDAIVQAPKLRWIHVSSSGITRYDNADFRASMSARGIPVTNSASVYNEACADHALAFLLAQSRRLPQCLASHAPNGSPDWLALRGASVPLKGQRAIILGYGAIGARLVELLQPFQMQIEAYRRQPRGDESVPVIGQDQLPQALAQAHHIVNILPDSPSTRCFFDNARFAQCRPGSVFYNIGRGTTVDQDALAKALASGTLKEAWLDVTEPEPLPPNHPLRSLGNCFITPHTAGGHYEEVSTCVRHFVRNLERFAASQPLLDQVI